VIQTKYLNDEYFTAEEIIENLVEAFNDPNKKCQGTSTLQQSVHG